MRERRLHDALQECLERMAAGASAEECARRYPDLAGELVPLLQMARITARVSEVRPRAEARGQVLAGVLEQWPERARWNPLRPFALLLRPAVVAAVLVLAIGFAGWGTVSASASSLPGDLLYPVKMTVERGNLFMARSDQAKALRYARQAEERSRELERVAQRAAGSSVMVSLSARSQESAKRAVNLLAVHDVPRGGPMQAMQEAPVAAPLTKEKAKERAEDRSPKEGAGRSLQQRPGGPSLRELEVRIRVRARLQRALEHHQQAEVRLRRDLSPAQRGPWDRVLQQRLQEWTSMLQDLESAGPGQKLPKLPRRAPRVLPDFPTELRGGRSPLPGGG